MKFVKRFKTEEDYNSYMGSDRLILPNISLIDEISEMSEEDSGIKFNSAKDEEENPNIFTFSVGGIEYQAENEMTWRDWVNSQYNVDGFFIHNNSYVCYGSFCVSSSSPVRAVVEKPTLSTPVQLDNKITPGGYYLLEIRI